MKGVATIFLLSTIIGSIVATIFNINATFQCSLSKNWCVQWKCVEYDYSDEDVIGSTSRTCSNATQQAFETRSTSFDDPRTEPFNFFVKVEHNCNKDGTTVKFEHKLPGFPATVEKLPIDFTIKL